MSDANELPAKTARERSNANLLPGGKPGNKGGTGRPPNTYKLFLADILESEEHREEFRKVAKNGNHPAFIAATKHATEHTIGKPKERVEHGGKLVVEFVRRKK